MTDKIEQEIRAKMTQHERRPMTQKEKRLERELDAAGALCAAQWTKLKRHEKRIARLETRIDSLEQLG